MGWYLPVSTHLVQTSQSRWVALTSFSPDDFTDDGQPTLVPQIGSSTADQGITSGRQAMFGAGDTLTVSPNPVTPGLADSEAFAELTKTPIPEKTSPLLDPAGLSPIGIPIDSETTTRSTSISQGPAPETLVPTVQPLTVTSAPKDTPAEHGPSVSVLAAREAPGTGALGDFGSSRSGTGNSTTAQDQGSVELLVLLAAVLLLATREWFRTGAPAQVVVPGMGGSSREPVIKTDGSAARDIREPDLATTGGLVSMNAAHLGAGVYLNPEDLYHLVVPGTDNGRDMTDGGCITTPPQTDPQPPEPEHVSPPEFDPNAEPVHLVPTSKSVQKVEPPARPAASPSQSSSSGSGSDGVKRISLGPVSGIFFTQGVITTTDSSGSSSADRSHGSGGGGSSDSDMSSFYEDFSSSYENSSSPYDDFVNELSNHYEEQGFTGYANFISGDSGLSDRDSATNDSDLLYDYYFLYDYSPVTSDSDLSEDGGYWYETEYRAGYDLSGEVPDFSNWTFIESGTDSTEGWDFGEGFDYTADSGMENCGSTREELSNEPSYDTYNPEYFQEELDYGLDSWDNNWDIQYSDGSDTSLDNEAVYSEYDEWDWGYDFGSWDDNWDIQYSDGSDTSLDNEAVYSEYDEWDWGYDLGSSEESGADAYDLGQDYDNGGSELEDAYEEYDEEDGEEDVDANDDYEEDDSEDEDVDEDTEDDDEDEDAESPDDTTSGTDPGEPDSGTGGSAEDRVVNPGDDPKPPVSPASILYFPPELRPEYAVGRADARAAIERYYSDVARGVQNPTLSLPDPYGNEAYLKGFYDRIGEELAQEEQKPSLVQRAIDAVNSILNYMGLAGGTTGSGTGQGTDASRMTPKEATEAAADLGYKRRVPPQKLPFDSKGQPGFFDGNRYITPDVTTHKGGGVEDV